MVLQPLPSLLPTRPSTAGRLPRPRQFLTASAASATHGRLGTAGSSAALHGRLDPAERFAAAVASRAGARREMALRRFVPWGAQPKPRLVAPPRPLAHSSSLPGHGTGFSFGAPELLTASVPTLAGPTLDMALAASATAPSGARVNRSPNRRQSKRQVEIRAMRHVLSITDGRGGRKSSRPGSARPGAARPGSAAAARLASERTGRASPAPEPTGAERVRAASSIQNAWKHRGADELRMLWRRSWLLVNVVVEVCGQQRSQPRSAACLSPMRAVAATAHHPPPLSTRRWSWLRSQHASLRQRLELRAVAEAAGYDHKVIAAAGAFDRRHQQLSAEATRVSLLVGKHHAYDAACAHHTAPHSIALHDTARHCTPRLHCLGRERRRTAATAGACGWCSAACALPRSSSMPSTTSTTSAPTPRRAALAACAAHTAHTSARAVTAVGARRAPHSVCVCFELRSASRYVAPERPPPPELPPSSLSTRGAALSMEEVRDPDLTLTQSSRPLPCARAPLTSNPLSTRGVADTWRCGHVAGARARDAAPSVGWSPRGVHVTRVAP
jgi:hypothetical protein